MATPSIKSRRQASLSQPDALLLSFFEATDEQQEETLLEQLIVDHIAPVIKRVITYKLRHYLRKSAPGLISQDAEEIYHDIQTLLVKRLRALKEDSSSELVRNLHNYVAVIAYNACDEFLRQRSPLRRRLKDQVRHHLSSQREFALWEDAGKGWLAALSDSGPGPEGVITSSDSKLNGEFHSSLRAQLHGINVLSLKLQDLLRMIFQSAGRRPIEFNYLITVIANLQGLNGSPLSFEQEEFFSPENFTSTAPGPDVIVEHRQIIQRLWAEIRLLPRRQRIALLLNLRSPQGINVITLFPLTNTATFEQIAEALEIPTVDFEKIWAALPMDDLSIATYIGATRQQVINLRKNARERLHRRMKAFQSNNAMGK